MLGVHSKEMENHGNYVAKDLRCKNDTQERWLRSLGKLRITLMYYVQ